MTSNLQWVDFLRIAAALQPQRYNIGALLRDVDYAGVYPVGDALVLSFVHASHLQRFMDEMESPLARKSLELMVSQAFGKPMTLKAILTRNERP